MRNFTQELFHNSWLSENMFRVSKHVSGLTILNRKHSALNFGSMVYMYDFSMSVCYQFLFQET